MHSTRSTVWGLRQVCVVNITLLVKGVVTANVFDPRKWQQTSNKKSASDLEVSSGTKWGTFDEEKVIPNVISHSSARMAPLTQKRASLYEKKGL